jgi:hypothetical protein
VGKAGKARKETKGMKETTRVLVWNFLEIFTAGIQANLAVAGGFQVDASPSKIAFLASADNYDILLVGTEEDLSGEDRIQITGLNRRKVVFFFKHIGGDDAVIAVGIGAYGILPMTASLRDLSICLNEVCLGRHSFPDGLMDRWVRFAGTFEIASVC